MMLQQGLQITFSSLRYAQCLLQGLELSGGPAFSHHETMSSEMRCTPNLA